MEKKNMNNFQAQITYENTELVPILSSETIDYHYGKHHCGYAKKLNALVKDTKYAHEPLKEIIIQSRDVDQEIFNNAAQLFNHDFYWKSLKLNSNRPWGKLMHQIDAQFGSLEAFLDVYETFANRMFGSGWSWLVLGDTGLNFFNGSNAENPIGVPCKPLCVIDLWEHAYYIDYRNDRAAYINKIIRECINWDFCSQQMT
jgi:Fe-Mn family superoxide dismutase